MAEVVAEQADHLAAVAALQVGGGYPANEEVGEGARLQAFEPAAQLLLQADADQVDSKLVIENPLQRLRVGHRFGEQVVHLQHFDATFAHLGDEVEVVALGLADPDDVVEEQLVGVVRSEPQVCQAGRADHHLAQLAGFGVHAEFFCGVGHGGSP